MTSEKNSTNSWAPWILALIVAIFLVFCFLHHLKGIDSDISSRSAQALSVGSISGITADVDGRDVTLNGILTSESNRIKAVETVSGLRGVNKVLDNLTVNVISPNSFKLSKKDNAVTLSAIVESEEEKTKLVDTLVSSYQLQKDQISSSIETGAAKPSVEKIIGVIQSASALSRVEISSSDKAFDISGIAPSDEIRNNIIRRTNELAASNLSSSLSVTENIQVPANLQLSHSNGGAVLSGNLPESEQIKSRIAGLPNLKSEVTYAGHYINDKWINTGIDLIENDSIANKIDTTVSPSSVELAGELPSSTSIENLESKVASMFGPDHTVSNSLTEALPSSNLQIALNNDIIELSGALHSQEQVDSTVDFATTRFPDSKIVNNLVVGSSEGNREWLELSLDSIAQLPESADFTLDASDSNITVQAMVETPEEQSNAQSQIAGILGARNNNVNIEYDQQAFDQKQAELERQKQAELAKQRLAELEKQRQAELEKQRLAELEQQRLAEIEKQRLAELEQQRLAEIEKQKQAELEKQRLAEIEKQKQAELEKQRLAEIEKQKQAELEKQRLAEIEKQKQAELEKQRLAEIEKQKQAELEKQRLAELERKKQEEIAQAISNLDLSGIQFASNSADILGESEGVLNQAYEVLKLYSSINVRVEGHTDSTGDNDLNLALSNARAESVKSYLVNKGISSQRIEAKGFGEENPIGPNNTAEGRKQNRRIEFKVIN